jgi:hypothetical protein
MSHDTRRDRQHPLTVWPDPGKDRSGLLNGYARIGDEFIPDAPWAPAVFERYMRHVLKLLAAGKGPETIAMQTGRELHKRIEKEQARERMRMN